MANSGIEVEIYQDDDPFNKIGVIDARQRPTLLREIGGHGAGSFQVAKSNKKIVKKPELLAYRNFVRIRVNNQCLGGFILKNKEHVIVGEGEQAEEVWSLSGEGLRSWGKDAKVRPANGLKANSRESRYFNFATERGSWYVPSQWTNAAQIVKWNSPPHMWGTAPAEWPDAPGAWWIWGSLPASPGTGGIHPIGVNYFRKEFNVQEDGQYALFFAADDFAEVYVDGELIHTTAELHSWQETAREDFELTAGEHVIAFKARQGVPNSPGAIIAAFYKIGDASSPTAARLLFYTDSSWKVCAYPAVEPGWTPGQILITLLNEAKARGIRFANNWTMGFTETHDSSGQPWGDPLAISFDIGLGYDEVFEALEEAACDIYLDPETLKLYAWKKRGVDRSLENPSDDVKPIILRVGHNLRTAEEKGQADIVNTLLLRTADGWSVKQPTNGTSLAKYGVLEGQIATEMSDQQAGSLIEEVFTKKALPEKTATFELIPVPGMVPFEDFLEGDYVAAPGEVPDVMEKRRVMSISIAEDDETGTPIYAVEFDAIFKDRTDDLAKMLSKATHSSALGAGFTGTSGTPQTATQGSNAQVPASSAPEAPTGLVVNTVGRWADNGTAVSDYGLTWVPVASNVNSLPVTDIESYEVWGRRSTEEQSALRVTVFDSFAYLSGYIPGEDWYFKVRARSRTGGWGAFSAETHLVADAPVNPMGPPSAPALTTDLGVVSAKWDGQIAGDEPPSWYKYMEVQRASSESGTYVTVSSFVSGSGIDTTGTPGTTYWYRFVAVDFLGVRSTPSLSNSIEVAGVDTSDLEGAISDAINGAIDTANAALTAANGKNKITFSNDAPTTDNVGIAGDMWYRRDGAGKLIGVWENTGGGTWVQRALTGSALTDLDAGTITTGFLGSDRIGANSITTKKMLIANLDNQLDNPNFETNSFLGWEQSGSTEGWDTPVSGLTYVNRYLRRLTTTATAPGQITNGFRVAVRPTQRVRIDAVSNCDGIAPGPWTESRRNYFPNPLAVGTGRFILPLLGDYSAIEDMPGTVPTAVRFTRTGAGTARIAMQIGTTLPRTGTLRVRMRVRASEAMTAAIQVRPALPSISGQVILSSSYEIPAGVSEIDVSGSAGSVTATADASIVIQTSSGVIGSTLDVTNVSVETSTSGALGGPFTGATTTTSDLEQFLWTGTPNDSQSVRQVRTAPSSIGAQFYNAAGDPLIYVPRALVSTSSWSAISWETDVPEGAYFASLRIEDAGIANTALRLGNLQFRLMGAGQLLVDGTIEGRHIKANAITGEKITAGSIEVDRLAPNVGSSLNLDGNTNINALVNVTTAMQQAQGQAQQNLDAIDAAADAAAQQAADAAEQAAAARFAANELQASIQQSRDTVANLGRTYRFTEIGAFIGSPDSPYEFVIQNFGAEIRYNGVAVSSWSSDRLIVNSFVGNEVVLGNHKLEKDTPTKSTVVRKIV